MMLKNYYLISHIGKCFVFIACFVFLTVGCANCDEDTESGSGPGSVSSPVRRRGQKMVTHMSLPLFSILEPALIFIFLFLSLQAVLPQPQGGAVCCENKKQRHHYMERVNTIYDNV